MVKSNFARLSVVKSKLFSCFHRILPVRGAYRYLFQHRWAMSIGFKVLPHQTGWCQKQNSTNCADPLEPQWLVTYPFHEEIFTQESLCFIWYTFNHQNPIKSMVNSSFLMVNIPQSSLPPKPEPFAHLLHHPRRGVHRVAEQAEARQLGTHHTCDLGLHKNG